MPKPEQKVIDEKLKELDSDPYYRTGMAQIKARLTSLVMSKAFSDAYMIPKLEADNKADAEFLNQKVKSLKLKEYPEPYADMIRVLRGLDSASAGFQNNEVLFNKVVNEVENEGKIGKAARKEAFVRLPAASLKKRKQGLSAAYMLPDLLMETTVSGKTVYEVLKDAAKEKGISEKDLLDDLQYLDEKFSYYDNPEKKTGHRQFINLAALDPASVPQKTRIPGERSWENYMKAHLTNVPHDSKGKQEYLAKALAAAFRAKKNELYPGKQTKFSVKQARKDAEELMKDPAFKKLCEHPVRLRELLNKSKENPDELYQATRQIYLPFAYAGKEECLRTLRRLKDMSMLMDSPDGRSSKYKAFCNSIRSIDLHELEQGNVKMCRDKLQDILTKNLNYMKGKKAVRETADERRRFNQSMDTLAVLAETGEYARAAAESVFDRINTVRQGHDPNHKPLKLSQYGSARIVDHTIKESEIAAYQKRHRWGDSEPVVEEKQKKNVYQPYPKMDQSLLVPWTDHQRQFKKDKPLRMNTELAKYADFVRGSENGKGKQFDQDKAAERIARILALSEMQMYHIPANRIGDYFTGKAVEGKRVKGSLVVISKKEFGEKYVSYMNHPAVRKLAEKYRNPDARKDLLKEGPKKEEPHLKGGIKQPGKKDENNLILLDDTAKKNVIIPEKQNVTSYDLNARPDAMDNYDPLNVNVEKLRSEYNNIVKQLEEENNRDSVQPEL